MRKHTHMNAYIMGPNAQTRRPPQKRNVLSAQFDRVLLPGTVKVVSRRRKQSPTGKLWSSSSETSFESTLKQSLYCKFLDTTIHAEYTTDHRMFLIATQDAHVCIKSIKRAGGKNLQVVRRERCRQSCT